MKQVFKIIYHSFIIASLFVLITTAYYQDLSIRALLDNQYAVAAIQDVQSQMIVRNMKDLDTARTHIGRLNRMLSITSLD